MKYFSMFSGIGGFELGILNAMASGRQRQKENKLETTMPKPMCKPNFGLSTTCIGFSEIDKYAIQIYKKHFPNHKEYGNARTINAEELPDFDFLIAGFPCQSFSIAGKRGGFEDTRGTLFFQIARIARAKRPKLLLLENVKGLLSHDKGKTFGTILETLSELGYVCEWQILNSKNFGVSQNRERVLIIGYFGRKGFKQVFPIGEIPQDDLKRNKQEPGRKISNAITGGYRKQNARGTYIMRDGRDNRSCLRSGRTPELGIKGMSIRRLTPTECERLQGFPDGWTEGISNTQRYKCLGNAVTVNVIEAIMGRLK